MPYLYFHTNFSVLIKFYVIDQHKGVLIYQLEGSLWIVFKPKWFGLQIVSSKLTPLLDNY